MTPPGRRTPLWASRHPEPTQPAGHVRCEQAGQEPPVPGPRRHDTHGQPPARRGPAENRLGEGTRGAPGALGLGGPRGQRPGELSAAGSRLGFPGNRDSAADESLRVPSGRGAGARDRIEARSGGADGTPRGTYDVRAEGLRVSVAVGATRQGPDLGFVLEGGPHLRRQTADWLGAISVVGTATVRDLSQRSLAICAERAPRDTSCRARAGSGSIRSRLTASSGRCGPCPHHRARAAQGESWIRPGPCRPRHGSARGTGHTQQGVVEGAECDGSRNNGDEKPADPG